MRAESKLPCKLLARAPCVRIRFLDGLRSTGAAWSEKAQNNLVRFSSCVFR